MSRDRRGRRTTVALAVLTVLAAGLAGCGSDPASPRSTQLPPNGPTAVPRRSGPQVGVWLTTPDARLRLAPRSPVQLAPADGDPPDLVVRDSEEHQQFFGVGASLTGSSARLLRGLPARKRDAVLHSLFDPRSGIGLSVLRQPMGGNDFSRGTFSYDDVPSGETDPDLTRFSLASDGRLVVPLLRRAARINPSLAVVLSPWSAPAWMKTSGSMVGGSLEPEWTDAYARYLARAVQAYDDAGVPVHGLTVQNEPFFSPPGYAGMTLDVDQQRAVIDRLAAALSAARLAPHVWALDDNYSHAADADSLLADPTTRGQVYGVAFHCYAGDVSALADLRAQHPDVPVAVSECSGGRWSPGYASDLRWETQQLVIRGIGAGASWLAKWNLALDPDGGPTNGGCGACTGLVTIDPATGHVSRSAAYDVWGHVGRFVVPGATVVGTRASGTVQGVAFRNPDGSHVLVALNPTLFTVALRVGWHHRVFERALPSGAVATFTWR